MGLPFYVSASVSGQTSDSSTQMKTKEIDKLLEEALAQNFLL